MSELTEFGRARPGSLNALVPRLVIAGAILTLAIATVWQVAWEHHQVAQSTADENLSAIVGPPCPQVSAPAFQSAANAGRGIRYTDDFNGVSFGRSFGDGDCSVAAEKGHALGSYVVCQFSGLFPAGHRPEGDGNDAAGRAAMRDGRAEVRRVTTIRAASAAL
jgi:hypothetical protein